MELQPFLFLVCFVRIMTFSSLKNSEVEDKDSDDEEGQRFYAGGSITSGQQVIGPPRNNADVITDMFQTAQKYDIFFFVNFNDVLV